MRLVIELDPPALLSGEPIQARLETVGPAGPTPAAECPAGCAAAPAEVGIAAFGDGRLAKVVRNLLVGAVARRSGAPEDVIEKAIVLATAERPIIDWLRNGGLEELIKLVMTLLPLFL